MFVGLLLKNCYSNIVQEFYVPGILTEQKLGAFFSILFIPEVIIFNKMCQNTEQLQPSMDGSRMALIQFEILSRFRLTVNWVINTYVCTNDCRYL